MCARTTNSARELETSPNVRTHTLTHLSRQNWFSAAVNITARVCDRIGGGGSRWEGWTFVVVHFMLSCPRCPHYPLRTRGAQYVRVYVYMSWCCCSGWVCGFVCVCVVCHDRSSRVAHIECDAKPRAQSCGYLACVHTHMTHASQRNDVRRRDQPKNHGGGAHSSSARAHSQTLIIWLCFVVVAHSRDREPEGIQKKKGWTSFYTHTHTNTRIYT